MNIAIISYYFNDHHAEGIVTAKLARALAEAGHTISVFGNLVGTQEIVTKHLTNLDYTSIDNDSPYWWRFLENILPSNILGKKIIAIPSLLTYNSPNDYGWILNVKKAFMKAHQEKPFDIIHSRLNPHSSHQAALFIKKAHPEIPWCAYFSDPWPPHRLPAPYQNSSGALSRWRSDSLMDSFLELAESHIFTSTYMRDYLIKDHRLKLIEKSFVAPHISPYWETPIQHIKKDTLTFRHAGILNKNRNPNILFDGIRKFLEKNKDATNSIRFEFMGRNYAGIDSKPIKPPHDLKDIVFFFDQNDLSETWHWIAQADILLLLEFHFSKGIFFYAKLSDYLHTARPILALSPKEGVVADLFKKGGGIIVPPDNSEQIASALDQIFTLWHSKNLDKIIRNVPLAENVHPNKVIPIYEQAFKKAIIENS
mgnify:FL=1